MEEKRGKLSVIVPVYNVEGYIERSIMSLVRQTYSNLEIILVDDGSTDLSGVICDQFAKEYPNIQVIHKTNGGLSDARNVGVAQATGDYIAFLDSDDYVHYRAYELMLYHMKMLDADVVECEYWKVWDQQEEKEYLGCAVEVQDRDQALTQLMKWKNFDISVWNKLYKREMVQDLLFPVGKICEDEFWTYRVLFRAKKLIHLFFPLHFYQQGRTTSILGTKFSEKNYASTEALFERAEFMKHNAPHLAEIANSSLVTHLFYHLNNFAKLEGKEAAANQKHFLYYAKILKELPEDIQKSYMAISKKEKLKLRVSLFLTKISIKLYWYVYRIWQKVKKIGRHKNHNAVRRNA